MLTTNLKNKVIDLVEAHLANPTQFLVDVSIYSYHQDKKKIIVTVDGNVSVSDCAKLTNSLSKDLENTDPLGEKYTLEVSTFGLDTPLKLKKQYTKNQGRKLQITLKNSTIIEGTLVDATDSAIHIEQEARKGQSRKPLDIPFDQIDKAFVQILFK